MRLSHHLAKFLCLSLMFFTSCASIICGPRQKISISTVPSQAEVWVDDALVGQSPLIVNLARKNHHYVRIELEGYHPYETILNNTVNGWVFGNFLFGGIGLIGIFVDVISGSIYRLTPEQIESHMQLNQVVKASKNDQTYIAIVMETDPLWEKIDQLTPIN